MDSFRKISKVLAAKNKVKKRSMADLQAGFVRMYKCVSTAPVVAAPVGMVQSPPLPSLQEAVAPVLEVAVPAPVIVPVDLLEAGPSSSVPDVVAAEVEMMSGLVSSYLGDSVRPSTLKVYKSYWGKFRNLCCRFGW